MDSKAVAAVAAAAEIQPYLTFQLSGELYAFGILNVKEIIEYGQLPEIPMMPAFIRGVINLRGIAPPSAFGAKFRADFIKGMGKINGKFVIILNIQRALSVDEVASLAVVSECRE